MRWLALAAALLGCSAIFPLEPGSGGRDGGSAELPDDGEGRPSGGEGEGEGGGEGEGERSFDAGVLDAAGLDSGDPGLDAGLGPETGCGLGELCDVSGGLIEWHCDGEGGCRQDETRCVVGEQDGRWHDGVCCAGGCWDGDAGRCSGGRDDLSCGKDGWICRDCTVPACVWSPNPACGAGKQVFWWLDECQAGVCKWSGVTNCCGSVEDGASCEYGEGCG